jgi:tetratricopeptide (TPR) repeat protein
MRIEVVMDDRGKEQVVAYDARELFDAANEALLDGRVDEALRTYDELVEDFADSDLVAPALYNAGLAHERKGEFDAAIARYRIMVRGEAPSRDLIDGFIRMGAVMAELERWSDAVVVFEELLARDDLGPADRIQALSRLGYVLVGSKDYVGAEQVLRSGLAYHEQISAETELLDTYYVAMCQYYLAQIPHRQFTAIPIRLPDKQTKRDMEAKADRLLIAHDRYLKTVEVGNVYWATASGYQIAAMQKEMWDALVIAPIPPRLGPEAADFYVKEVHRLSRQFLEKATDTHQRNVEMADRLGTSTTWTEASRREALEIADFLARESAGEIVLPNEGNGGPNTLDIGPDSGRAPSREYVPGRVEL